MDDIDRLVRSVAVEQVADWLVAYLVKKPPDVEELRRRLMAAVDAMAARVGWALTADAARADLDRGAGQPKG